MKRRNIFLDFTPLLDVTMIILFFFILFSSMEVFEEKASLAEQAEQLELTQAELDAGLEQVRRELDIIRDESGSRASDLEAMAQFDRSGNLKLILDVESSHRWVLRALWGEELLKVISPADPLGETLQQLLEEAGYDRSATVFCDFVLDGSQPGTASAYRQISRALRGVKEHYTRFYYSETDTSAGKE